MLMSGAAGSAGPVEVGAGDIKGMNRNHDNEPRCCQAWPSGFILGKLGKELGPAG